VVELLVRTLGIKPSQVELLSGDSSRSKRFKLEGVTPELVDAALEQALAGPSSR
jgi:uncharacterized protein YggU (UPF0235/DUF167 family)